MKVQELIELASNSKNKMLKQEQLQVTLQKQLEVKDYLGIKDKKQLISDIVNECILFEDGVYKFDDIEKYVCFTMRVIATYTNLELSDDIENDYDDLCKAQLLNTVIETFLGEYENIKLLFQMKCDDVLSANNIESQTGRFLTALLEKTDVVVESLSNKIDKFDMQKLPISTKNLGKLIEFVKSQNK